MKAIISYNCVKTHRKSISPLASTLSSQSCTAASTSELYRSVPVMRWCRRHPPSLELFYSKRLYNQQSRRAILVDERFPWLFQLTNSLPSELSRRAIPCFTPIRNIITLLINVPGTTHTRVSPAEIMENRPGTLHWGYITVEPRRG